MERQELLEFPKEEEELALIYRSKGLPNDQARSLAPHLMADRNNALDTLSNRLNRPTRSGKQP